MFKRLIKLFTDRKYWVRQIVVAGIAGAVSWIIGDALVPNGGVVAAIVSTLSIRISLHKSLREGFGQIVGTAIGAGVALLTVTLFDFGFLAVGSTIVLCAVVARALHLGEVASVNVPVTALIVIGPGISGSTATHRLLSTLIGAAVAAPMRVDSNLWVAVEPEIPGPITISAVTGTFTEATSPSRNPRATTEQSKTVAPTAIKPKLKK